MKTALAKVRELLKRKPSLQYALGLEALHLIDYMNGLMDLVIETHHTNERDIDGQIWLCRSNNDFIQEIKFAMKVRKVKPALQLLENLGLIVSAESETKASKWYTVDKDNFSMFVACWHDHKFPPNTTGSTIAQGSYDSFIADYQKRSSTPNLYGTLVVKQSLATQG